MLQLKPHPFLPTTHLEIRLTQALWAFMYLKTALVLSPGDSLI